MTPRVLFTGIPSHYTRMIQRAHGTTVVYSEKPPRPEAKDQFIKEIQNISNTGNYLIAEGALAALPDTTTHIPFWHLYNCYKNGQGFAEINRQFDICVFSCANLLRKGLSADAEAEVLANLDMPVVMLGIGLQQRDDLDAPLPAGTQRLLAVLKQKTHYFLTRGEETAAFLRQQGFSNVRPTGCPSIYLAPENVRHALGRLREIKIGQAKTVFTGYLGAELGSIADINALTAPDATSSYVIQDELIRFQVSVEPDADGRVYNSASGELIGQYSFKGAPQLQRSLKLHAFFDTHQWRAWSSTMDFAFGRRFHGSMIALQAGVPSLMVVVDDRMREMLNFVGLPSVEADVVDRAADRAECVASHVAGIDVSQVIAKYDARESNFRSALREIGLN